MYTVNLASMGQPNDVSQLHSAEDIGFAMEHSSIMLDVNEDRMLSNAHDMDHATIRVVFGAATASANNHNRKPPATTTQSAAATISSSSSLLHPRMWYEITYNDTTVTRSYSDFAGLRRALQTRFPGAVVPPLPPPLSSVSSVLRWPWLFAGRASAASAKQQQQQQQQQQVPARLAKHKQLLLCFLQACAKSEYFGEDDSLADFVAELTSKGNKARRRRNAMSRQQLTESGELSAASKRWSFWMTNQPIPPHVLAQSLAAVQDAQQAVDELVAVEGIALAAAHASPSLASRISLRPRARIGVDFRSPGDGGDQPATVDPTTLAYDVLVAKSWLRELRRTTWLVYQAELAKYDVAKVRGADSNSTSRSNVARAARLEDVLNKKQVQANRLVRGVLLSYPRWRGKTKSVWWCTEEEEEEEGSKRV